MGSNIITANIPLIKSLVDLAIEETLTANGYVDTNALSIALASKLDKTFASSLITNISVALTSTDVNLELESIAPTNGQIATGLANIPLATQTTPGIMPKEAYAQIHANTQAISALSQLGGRFVGSFPTKADLLDYELQTSDARGNWATVQADESNDNALARYFLEDDGNDGLEWVLDYLISYATTPQATNESLGIVKGEDTDGKIFVEEDGTMSLVGYASLGTDLANLSESLSSISSSKENTISMPSTGPLAGLTPSQAFAILNNFLSGSYVAPATISANGFNAVVA